MSRNPFIRYRERLDARHVDMIARYPSCFRNRTGDFEELLVAYIEATYRKLP